MEAMIQEVTGVKALSLHHDISTVTGEEVVLFRWPTHPLSARQRENKPATVLQAVNGYLP
jgi:uncharacterized protein YbcI